jgi:hypothetical protein
MDFSSPLDGYFAFTSKMRPSGMKRFGKIKR